MTFIKKQDKYQNDKKPCLWTKEDNENNIKNQHEPNSRREVSRESEHIQPRKDPDQKLTYLITRKIKKPYAGELVAAQTKEIALTLVGWIMVL